MVNEKTKQIYSNEGEIKLFYSPGKRSIVSKILNKEYKIVMDTIKNIALHRGTKLSTLDIGCSSGRYCFALSKLGFNTIGIDISKKAIDFANKKKKQFKLQNLNFKVGEATNLKFKKNSFDLIICIEVLHHLSNKELKKTFQEIHKVLKPNGILIIDLKNKLNPIINLTYKHHTNKTFKNTGHLMLTRTPYQYTQILKDIGYKIIKTKSIFSPIKTFAPIIIYTVKNKKTSF